MKNFTLTLTVLLLYLSVQSQISNPCVSEPTVTYEGKTYTAIQVGDKCWFTENLNVGTMVFSGQNQTNNGVVEKYCYNDIEANCEVYGGFYQWNEALQYSTESGSQGICPPGWRIPTDDEWKMLEGLADSQFGTGDPVWDEINFRGFDAGLNLKASQGWNYNGSGTDELGLSVLPGGHRDFCGSYYSEGHSIYLWTSTAQDDKTAWYRMISSGSQQISRRYAHQNMGASVRCMKDEEPQTFTCGTSTVSDSDENEYTTIAIGDKCWTVENLRTTRYSDGTNITTGLSSADWANTMNTFEGAYAIFDYNHPDAVGIESEAEMVDIFGNLYNWFAVDDQRGICPQGWHVPTDEEWAELTDYIGGTNIANKLKSCRQVSSPLGGECATSDHPRWNSNANHFGTDVYGFSAFPAGQRNENGLYTFIGTRGTFWSATMRSATFSWHRQLTQNSGAVTRGSLSKATGYSIRCVKND